MRANSPARRRNADRKGGVSVLVCFTCWSVSVEAVPELPKVDLSQPVEIDIIDAERYVLFYLEVTAVA